MVAKFFTFLRCERGAAAGARTARPSATRCRRTPVPKTTRKKKRKAWPRANGADQPGPYRGESSKRSEANRSSSSLQCNGIRAHQLPKRRRLRKAPAENDVRHGGRISPGLATDDFDVHTSGFRFRTKLTRLGFELPDFCRRNRIRIDPINFLILAKLFAG